MPSKYGYRKYGRKKRATRKKPLGQQLRQKQTKINFMTAPVGLPDRYHTIIRYINTFTLDTAGGGFPVSSVYRGNSVFDPDVSGIGGQPMGRDQLAPQYVHYHVNACRCVLKAVLRPSSGGINAGILTLLTGTDSTATTVMLRSMQQARAKYRLLGSGGQSYRIETKNMSSDILPRFTASQLAFVGSNPPDQWFFHVIAEGITPGTDAVVDCTIELYYDVTFQERVRMTQS